MSGQIRRDSDHHTFLCFEHAVKMALAGIVISETLGDYDGEYGGYTGCTACAVEHEYAWYHPTDAQRNELEKTK